MFNKYVLTLFILCVCVCVCVPTLQMKLNSQTVMTLLHSCGFPDSTSLCYYFILVFFHIFLQADKVNVNNGSLFIQFKYIYMYLSIF